MNGNGVPELVVGAPGDGGGAQVDRGAAWVLFLDDTGNVIAEQRIADGAGDLEADLLFQDAFGHALAHVGDVDRDGLPDLAVGAPGRDVFGIDHRGSVFMLHLRSDGSVREENELGADPFLLQAANEDWDRLGQSLAFLGDLDGDTGLELVAGALNHGPDGSLFVLSAWPDPGEVEIGRLVDHGRIASGEGGLTATLDDEDGFGSAVAALGDRDGDGVPDVAVGAPGEGPIPTTDRGAVHVLFLDDDGSVASERRIGQGDGGFGGALGFFDRFGSSVAALGDLDGNGVTDVAVGAPFHEVTGIGDVGAVWILFLQSDGLVRDEVLVTHGQGGFGGTLTSDPDDGGVAFGSAVAGLGDVDGDGIPDLAVGAPFDEPAGVGTHQEFGAVWVLFLNANGTVKAEQKIDETFGGFGGDLQPFDQFGAGLAGPGDVDGDGIPDFADGWAGDTDGGTFSDDRAALWVLQLNSAGSVASHTKLSSTTTPWLEDIVDDDRFAQSLAPLGDLDGDGVADLLAGANGSLRLLLLDTDGGLKAARRFDDQDGHLEGLLAVGAFGPAVASLGDVDGDGFPELAAGAPSDDLAGPDRGALWVLSTHVSPWTLLPGGPPGTHGIPRLLGQGDLLGDDVARIVLQQALPGSTATLVLGAAAVNAPFKQGLLVPLPQIVVPGLPISDFTLLDVPMPWPPGLPSGVSLWWQYWIADPQAPVGLAGSTGLRLTTP